MCGSGTLLIEAALMAADVAPGLTRDYFGLLGWRGHDAALWQGLLDEARQRRHEGIGRLPPMAGFDIDAKAIDRAGDNLRHVGFDAHVSLQRQAIEALQSPWPQRTGLLVCNPPYGERLAAPGGLAELYADMGDRLRAAFPGWRLMLLVGDSALGARLGLTARSSHKLDNGPLACQLNEYAIPGGGGPAPGAASPDRPDRPDRRSNAAHSRDPNASMFANRLRKNLRTIGSWARRNNIDCYRLYDADMPEYAFAVDHYQSAQTWIIAQEYQAPASIDKNKAAARRHTVLETLQKVLEVPAERVVLKTRHRQSGGEQYQRVASEDDLHEVREHGCRLLVNFHDRLDTGLFLDHRQIRQLVRELAAGRRFLNLFAYTGSATVQAVAGGASATTSVDLSARYLEWERRNLALNGFSGARHTQIRADCLDWLANGPHEGGDYGVILLDTPTFSNSKRMSDTLDVQRDHAGLIRQAARRLAADGVLIFSNHLKQFRMDREVIAEAGLDLEDITRQTIPRDFARNPRSHHCWRIRRR
jgi:23S rRNA (guanine2445-N2)-methyltransferase / 23S rRNA (guanine2069-N7)-methyltransferase